MPKKARSSSARDYGVNVFINCPFDARYQELFEPLVFTVTDCGFIARCAKESDDAGEARIQKILKIIRDCRIGIHDISRTESNPASGLPRFNMPLELGMFLGAKEYGNPAQARKVCLVLDKEKFRYQQFISDIGGQDIHAHDDKVENAVKIVRDFLGDLEPGVVTPGPAMIHARYTAFTNDLPALCAATGVVKDELTFNNLRTFVEEWLKEHPPVFGTGVGAAG